MRNRLFLSLIAAAMVVAGTANAGALVSATWQSTLQDVSLTITNTGATCTELPSQAPGTGHTQRVISSCSPGGLTPTGAATGTSYSVSLTVPLFSMEQYTTGGAVTTYTKATLMGAQTVMGNSTAAAGNPGVAGIVTVKNGVPPTTYNPMYTPGNTTFVMVPLSVGKAGKFVGMFNVLGQPHFITVDFYAWQPLDKTFVGLTSKKAVLPSVKADASFNIAGGGGTVTLVSPSKVSIDGALAQRRTASFTSLKLTYSPDGVPEPGTLLLLGAGALGLVLVGGRKR